MLEFLLFIVAMTALPAAVFYLSSRHEDRGRIARIFMYILLPTSFSLIYFNMVAISLSEITIYLLVTFYLIIGLSTAVLVEGGLNKRYFRPFLACVISMPFLYMITSSTIFNSEDYRARLNVVQESEFDSSLVLTDQSQGRYVDEALAKKAASTLLSQRMGLGSRYVFDDMRIQSVNGQLYWVAPLINKSFFRWWDDANSPGFVMVSATDFNDAELVLDKHTISYGDDGFYFKTNVMRKVYFGGYAEKLTSGAYFEVRDGDLKPFWVIPLLSSKTGVSVRSIDAVVLVDASTGEIEEYSVKDAPSWVDRIVPESLFDSQINDWGSYINGWVNAWFIGDDVISTTKGMQLTYTADGRAMWYSGVQSQGTSQEATMGFVLGDSRTGETVFYRREGLTEFAAKQIMEGDVQEAGYRATDPQPYNVNGSVAYVSILKDDSGNRQGYGMVAYNNRDVFATGKTPEMVKRAYLSKLASSSSGNAVAVAGGSVERLESVVSRVGFTGNMVTLMVADEAFKKVLFTIPKETFLESTVTQVGDRVVIEFSPVESSSQPVMCFDNVDIAQESCFSSM